MPAPKVTTGESKVVETSVLMEATVTPEEELTSDPIIEWGLTESYGKTQHTWAKKLKGTSPITVKAFIGANLSPHTIYHYRVSATNASGTTKGTDKTFETGVEAAYPKRIIEDGAEVYFRENEPAGMLGLTDCVHNITGPLVIHEEKPAEPKKGGWQLGEEAPVRTSTSGGSLRLQGSGQDQNSTGKEPYATYVELNPTEGELPPLQPESEMSHEVWVYLEGVEEPQAAAADFPLSKNYENAVYTCANEENGAAGFQFNLGASFQNIGNVSKGKVNAGSKEITELPAGTVTEIEEQLAFGLADGEMKVFSQPHTSNVFPVPTIVTKVLTTTSVEVNNAASAEAKEFNFLRWGRVLCFLLGGLGKDGIEMTGCKTTSGKAEITGISEANMKELEKLKEKTSIWVAQRGSETLTPKGPIPAVTEITKIEAPATGKILISKNATESGEFTLLIGGKDFNELRIETNNAPVRLKKWHYLCVTFKESGTKRVPGEAHLYVDGRLMSTHIQAGTGSSELPWKLQYEPELPYTIGRANGPNEGFAWQQGFNGKQAELAVYKKVLTAQQIKEHYKLGFEELEGSPSLPAAAWEQRSPEEYTPANKNQGLLEPTPPFLPVEARHFPYTEYLKAGLNFVGAAPKSLAGFIRTFTAKIFTVPATITSATKKLGGMVSFWEFQEESGTEAKDAVGSNNGTYETSPHFTLNQPGPATGSKSVKLDGTENTVVKIPNAASLEPEHITFGGWVLAEELHAGAGAFLTNTFSSKVGMEIGFGPSSGEGTVMTCGTYNGAWYLVEGGEIETNKWYFVAGTYDGTTLKFYKGKLNGTFEKAGEKAVTGKVEYDKNPTYIGRRHDSGVGGTKPFWAGRMAFAFMTKEAATETQLKEIFEAATTPAITKLTKEILNKFTASLKPVGTALSKTLSLAKTFAAKLELKGAFNKFVPKELTAKLELKGAFSKAFGIAKAFAAKLEFVGALKVKVEKIIMAAALTFVGTQNKIVPKLLTAKLTFVGLLTQMVTMVLTLAKLTFVGSLLQAIIKKLAVAKLTSKGSIFKEFAIAKLLTAQLITTTVKIVTGFTSQLGVLGNIQLGTITSRPANAETFLKVLFIEKTFAAKLESVGLLRKTLAIAKAFTAKLTSTGSFNYVLLLTFVAKLTFVGAATKAFEIAKAFSAKLTYVGSVAKAFSITKALEGAALTFVGVMTKGFTIPKEFAALLKPIGSFVQMPIVVLAASLKPVGAAFSKVFAIAKNLAGKLEFIGKLETISIGHKIVTVLAKLTFAGQTSKPFISKFLEATFKPTGIVTKGFTVARAFAASLQPVGAIRKALSIAKEFAGKLTSVGSQTKAFNIAKALSAQLTFVGIQRKAFSFARVFAATLTSAGTFAKVLTIAKTFAAKLTTVGSQTKTFEVAKTFVAQLTYVGSVSKNMVVGLLAKLTSTGVVTKAFSFALNLTSKLTFVAELIARGTAEKIVARVVFKPEIRFAVYGYVTKQESGEPDTLLKKVTKASYIFLAPQTIESELEPVVRMHVEKKSGLLEYLRSNTRLFKHLTEAEIEALLAEGNLKKLFRRLEQKP